MSLIIAHRGGANTSSASRSRCTMMTVRPPHIHVKYNEHQARFVIETGELMSGSLSACARRLVQEWIDLRRQLLTANWLRMEAGEQMERIEGLE